MNSNKAKTTKTTEELILEILEKAGKPCSPRELIDRFKQEKDLGETAIREAIWELIDRGEVSLTKDRKFQRIQRAA